MIASLKSLKFQPNPFRFLLYTEWVLLASCGSLAVVEAFKENHLPVQHMLILLTLWLLGLVLPMGKLWVKLVYTGFEIGLIFYGAMMGYLHILPMLYLIVVIRSCFLFDPRGRWTIAGLTLVLFLLHQIRYVQTIASLVDPMQQERFWMHLIAETLMFGLGLFLVLKLANALLSERKIQAQLVTANEQLQQYALQAEDLAATQERNRIARDIHDSLGHALTALNVQLQTAVKLWRRDPDQAEPFLEQAQQLGTTAMQEVRKSVSALREGEQEEQPLEEAIAALVQNFRQSTGVTVFTHLYSDVTLPLQVTKTVYRVVQESMTNVAKHAGATAVEIRLWATSDYLSLKIEDDGCGFRLTERSNGFGLQGMQERVIALGGRFWIETAPENGCLITVELPLLPHDSSIAGGRPEPHQSGIESDARARVGFASRGYCK